jgi:hypothetical protein
MFYANRPDPWAKWSLLDNKHPFDLRAHVANVGVSISPGQHQNENYLSSELGSSEFELDTFRITASQFAARG